MDSMREDRKIPLCVAAAATSGAMLWFGTGLQPIWWITWFATVPVLLAASRISARAASLVAFVAWSVGALNEWSYYSQYMEMPLLVAIGSVVGPALIFAFAVSLWRRFVMREAPLRAALAFASLWVSYEFMLQKFSPHSTFGSIAYSQADCLPILQVASLAGLAGITFLLFFCAGTGVALIAVERPAKHKVVVAGAATAAILFIFAWGIWRIGSNPPTSFIKVGLIATDQQQNLSPQLPAEQKRLFSEYASAANQLMDQGAQIVVIPEKTARVMQPSIGNVDDALGGVARSGVTVVAGVERWTALDKRNEARIYSAGTLTAIYEKHHMLPAFESYLMEGKELTLLDHPSGRWGVEICKDMDFPALSREYGSRGAGLMLVPAWDFEIDGWLHDRMAVVRGVESGFSVARAARQGLLSLSDDRGGVLAEKRSDSEPYTMLLAEIPVRQDATLYMRLGNWFAWLNVLLFVGLFVNSRLGS